MKCEACGHENVEEARFCAGCGVLLPAPTRGEDPLVGQVIGGRFLITGVLGEGGMGVVYVGEQQMGTTVRKVAVKTLHPQLSSDPSVLARFHRECGTVAQLEHPNTIKVFDFGATSDGTLYIAMEFVNGRPLSEVIAEQGPLPPDRVLKIMRQVCGALDEAHEQGIVHRDLKPENLILTDRAGESDFVKVLDFGIAARSESGDAKKEQKLTQQGMVLGTPPYMSPEQFTGKALDRRSDIYSLAVVAYEMLTGRLPFDADTPWQWATQHMTAQPIPFESAVPKASIPQPMRTAILRALSKEPAARQATAREFFAELSGGGGITQDEPVVRGQAATAAMDAVIDFGAVPGVPAMTPPGTPQAATPAGYPGGAPQLAYAQPGPGYLPAGSPAAQKGHKKPLVVALGGAGALLVLALVVVALVKLKPKPETADSLVNPFSSASGGPTTIAPQIDTGPAVASVPTPQGTPAQPAVVTRRQTGPSTSRPAASQPDRSASGTADTQACSQCIAQARGGNITGAASLYGKCTDTNLKKVCSREARARAPAAVQAAVFAGNCRQAQAVAIAANSMGAASPELKNLLARCP